MADLVYGSPPWLLTLAFLAVGLAVAWTCQALVRRCLGNGRLDGHTDLVNFSVTNIAVLYGVLLAFLTVVSWEGLSKASDDAGVEASLIGALYHDAQGLAPPLAADVENHIRQYLDTVILREWPLQAEGTSPPEGSAALADLHRHVARLSPADNGDTVVMGDMLRVLNQLDAARATRIEALGGHIPGLVWTLIVAMGLLLVGFAALIPARDARIQAGLLAGFVAAIVLVLVMIVELDNPYRGSLSVSVEPFERARSVILRPPPTTDPD
ncbi:DUF4239 domain-containing protein [Lichenibacterium dinghuense]|uniref:bestrophin-like domain n=1 Tax=Lichenibacterium dinghuense TaxID=2895977 RepID=UPI001F182B0F|nr:DUF4239 domain-containing protein [Lichenibacterium sp. 6Y81]